MGRERRCILCHTMYHTKQEMEEHMRSMPHHRKLENLKGRDGTHECRVCRISVVGLTGYANHISSSLHKIRVEQLNQGKGPEPDEEYFDAELVHLVEQRRKEEEEETAAQAEEKQQQRKQHWGEKRLSFQQHRSPTSGYSKFPLMQNGHSTSDWQLAPHPEAAPRAQKGGDGMEGAGNWHHGQEFHTGGTSDFQNWSPRDLGRRGGRGAKKRHYSKYPFQKKGRFSMSHASGQHKRWVGVNAMGMDFTSDQLPMSCMFHLNMEKDRLEGDFHSPLGGCQSLDGKQQAKNGRGRGSRFVQSKGRVNRFDSFHWSSPEQDEQLQAMMQKAKQALQTNEGAMSTFAFKPNAWVPHGSSPQEPGALESLDPKMNRNGHPEKAGENSYTKGQSQSLACKAKCSSPNASTLQSVQISPKEAFPVAPEGQNAEVKEERSREVETLEEVAEQVPKESVTAEGLGLDSDMLREVQALASAPLVPNLNKLDLPTSLKQDLTRHMSKVGAHEPNLNISCRIHNLSGQQKPVAEQELGLKPTLRQLISSSGARRTVNWDQVYQEVSEKKQGQGKGFPRFGIEMVAPVPSDPEGLSLGEEEEPSLSEGFRGESFGESSAATAGTSTRKRSLSESNVKNGHRASTYPEVVGVPSEPPKKGLRLNSVEPSTVPWVAGGSLSPKPSPAKGSMHDDPQGDASSTGNPEDDVSIISGVKQKDSHGARTSGTDATSAVSKQGQQKTSGKAHSQVSQLLTLSLREDELNTSLQALEDSLIQARTALQAAYMELQRLLMVKQQITKEMNTLRVKRIEILQGMQETYESGSSPELTPEPSRAPPASESLLGTPSQPLLAAPPHRVGVFPMKQELLSPSLMSPGMGESPQAESCGTTRRPTISTPEMEVTVSHSSPPEKPRGGVMGDSCVDRIQNPARGTSGKASVSEAQAETRPIRQDEADYKPPPATESGSESTHQGMASRKKETLEQQKMIEEAVTRKGISDSSDVEKESADLPTKAKKKSKGTRISSSSTMVPAEKRQGDGPPLIQGRSELSQGSADSDSSSSLTIVDNPEGPPREVVSVDSSEPEDELGEPTPVKTPVPPSTPAPPHLAKGKHKRLTCDEVSSTSQLPATVKLEKTGSETKEAAASGMASSQLTAPLELGAEHEPSEGCFEGHLAAVSTLQIHGGCLYTCSEDKTARAFNLVTRQCTAVFEGHSAKINCLFVSSGPGLQFRLYTGSSDHTIRCYSLKNRQCVQQFCMLARVLCLHSRWRILYAGLSDGCVVSFNLKTNRQLDVFDCHGPRAVSCLASTQEGARRILLVGSYDSTISVRDAKSGLLLRTLKGHTKTVLCMKVVNDLVFSGSSDQSVHAYNIHTGELKRIYKGHSHAVTVVAILGKVMITACLDKLVRVYELQSHDRLQVYGGHQDMVMCMAIHKSLIYTGCYDGSIQAVRLNLMQNYRCWWHGCSLIFGVMAHLHQHLLTDHANPTFQTLKCRWRTCDAFFTARDGSNEAIPMHMQRHAEEDSSPGP